MHALPASTTSPAVTTDRYADRATLRDLVQGLYEGPLYAPPYATPLHDAFARHLVKHLREDARLEADAEVETPGAFFTVDFLVTVQIGERTRRVALELGAARSARDRAHRLRRDALLVACGAVDAVYRVRGSDLRDRLEDTLYVLSRWDPALFSERGLLNLRTLATPEARTLRLRPEQPFVQLTYVLDPTVDLQRAERHLWHAANRVMPFVQVRRLDRRFPDVWRPYVDAPAEAAPALRRLAG